MRKRRFRRLRWFASRLLLVILGVIAAYVAYLFMTYHRLPNTSEQHSMLTEKGVAVGEECTALTWNLGFGAYSQDFSFFMDGGTEGRAFSEQHVYDDLVHCVALAKEQEPDFALFQEVDRKATRSWHIDEADLIRETLGDYQSYYAQNYSSPYFIVPLKSPHGAAKSGIITFANRDIFRSERFSLPVETGWRKLLDLDRCFTICRVPVDNGRQLCVYNLHLSAYTADGAIATEQLKMLLQSMKDEYDAGNYAVAGGDFNKDLLGNSGEIFGVSGEENAWAQPIDMSLFPDALHLVDSLDTENPVPTCRNCDTGYIPGQTFVVTVDDFIVTDNVEVVDCHVIDDDFQCSDHNPVVLRFKLKEDASDAPIQPYIIDYTTEEPT